LINRVNSGEEITIAKAGKPLARIVPIEREIDKRVPGSAKDKIIL